MKLIKRITAIASAGIAALVATAACASSQPKAPEAARETVNKATVTNTEQHNTTEYVDTITIENTDTNTNADTNTNTETNADYTAEVANIEGTTDTDIDNNTNDTQIETSSPDAETTTIYEEYTEITKIQTTEENMKKIPIVLTETKETSVTDRMTIHRENKAEIKKTKDNKANKVNIEDTTITEATTTEDTTIIEDTTVEDTTDTTIIEDTDTEDAIIEDTTDTKDTTEIEIKYTPSYQISPEAAEAYSWMVENILNPSDVIYYPKEISYEAYTEASDAVERDYFYYSAGPFNGWLSANEMYLDTQFSYEYDERHTFVNTQIEAIAHKIFNPSMSDEEKLLALDNWFRDEYSYIYEVYDVYTALQLGGGVCTTYAQLADILCAKAGIECLYVSGDADNGLGEDSGSHAWNKVKVNGKWYYVDYTWNISHQYYLTETLWEDHSESDTIVLYY